VEVTQTQYHRPIPLIRNLNCVRNGEGQDKGADSNPDGFRGSPDSIFGVCQCGAKARNYNEYQYCKRPVLFHFNYLRSVDADWERFLCCQELRFI
jgi:hypothetical protein